MIQLYYECNIDELCLRNPENYRRLRLITSQYVMHRTVVHSLTTLQGVEKWLNENHLALFNVPMNFLDTVRNVYVRPQEMKFCKVVEADIDTNSSFATTVDEPILGKGWSGELVVTYPSSHTRILSRTLQNGLIAYGIYIDEVEYRPVGTQRIYHFKFSMLQRDFNTIEFQKDDWLDSEPMTDEEIIANMSPDDVKKWNLEQIFSDDAQFNNMDFDDDFD